MQYMQYIPVGKMQYMWYIPVGKMQGGQYNVVQESLYKYKKMV